MRSVTTAREVRLFFTSGFPRKEDSRPLDTMTSGLKPAFLDLTDSVVTRDWGRRGSQRRKFGLCGRWA